MLMFLSPIFFSASALPARWQPLLGLNPIAKVIEQTRRVSVEGLTPQPAYVIMGLLISSVAGSCQK
jgi:lipopolysaccharide transport system permease protein